MRVGPLFSNTLAHCAGIAVFSLLFYLFLVDWKRWERLRSGLSAIAAALGLIWNAGNLFALAPGFSQHPAFHLVHMFAFSAISFFPAVLLHLWCRRRIAALWIGGYLLSLVAALLQIRAESTSSLLPHQAPSLLIAIGFGGLTLIGLCQSLLQPRSRWAGWRLTAAMLLLLPAILFVSYNGPQGSHFHHVGIPLSLFVLLFDFRFLILDAFSRFFLKTVLVASGALLTFLAMLQSHFIVLDPFRAALALSAIFAGFLAIVQLSPFIDRLTTWFLRRHSRQDPILAILRDYPVLADSDDEYLDHARCTIEAFFQCDISEFRELVQCPELEDFPGAVTLFDRSRRPILNSARWAQAALPLRFSNGDGRLLLLGSRRGRRPYRNEDLLSLARFGRIIEEQVERRRQFHAKALLSHAELRALQAQINPHFFFNSLNTLYAAIARDNNEARRLVLNLADVFHYLLRSDRTFVSLAQELAIINAYLEIEKLRLGSRLTTSFQIDENLLQAEIPVLSIQPLVENAVKHGVAPFNSNGFVALTVKYENDRLKIEVANTGRFGASRSLSGAGVGLDNVKRRLALCYGLEAELHISSQENLTVVSCSMPLSIPASNRRPKAMSEDNVPDDIREKTA